MAVERIDGIPAGRAEGARSTSAPDRSAITSANRQELLKAGRVERVYTSDGQLVIRR
jgi:hypothetical protein